MRSRTLSVGPHEVRRIRFSSLKVATAIVGVVAIGSMGVLLLGDIDICGGISGWWVATLLISPLIFAALCLWCAIVAPSDAQQGAWIAIAALVVLLYIPGAFVTIMSGSLGTLWC